MFPWLSKISAFSNFRPRPCSYYGKTATDKGEALQKIGSPAGQPRDLRLAFQRIDPLGEENFGDLQAYNILQHIDPFVTR